MGNITITKAQLKTENVLNMYDRVSVSISGGSDSDDMLDLITKLDLKCDVRYVFYDTGLEYAATKRHLDYLDKKYSINIDRVKVKKPIPVTVKEKGQPFVSKQASEMLSRLQSHNFKWEDGTYETLIKKYPNCSSALKWWTNEKEDDRCKIERNKYLKEFIMMYPPEQHGMERISGACCDEAKKKPDNKYRKENNIQLSVLGIRKAEGGTRQVAYKECFNEIKGKFLPILWFKNVDKYIYEKEYNVVHSECYTVYGLERTGCAGCPFGRKFEFELKVLNKYEPKLFKAVNNIFKESYAYTRKYKDFIKTQGGIQISLFNNYTEEIKEN